jgi:Icc protein
VVRIVHASDFHFTGPYFQEHLWEEFKRQMDRIQPHVLVVTGDITDEGYPHEYTVAKRYLCSLTVEKLVVPGNHDARNVGYEAFEEFFGPRWSAWERDGVVILGGDSSEPDIDDGHIGRENYQLMEDVLHKEGFKIFALHHHLLPIPGTGRERNIPVDAGDVLKIITDAGVNLVLSGHKHLPWVWRLESTIFITAGTATTTRVKGKVNPSFIHIVVEEDGSIFAVEKVELPSGETKSPLLSRGFGLSRV